MVISRVTIKKIILKTYNERNNKNLKWYTKKDLFNVKEASKRRIEDQWKRYKIHKKQIAKWNI